MKKILLSSFVLILFSASIIIFQMSCRKTVNAQTSTIVQPLNKTLLSKTIQMQSTAVDSSGHSVPLYRFYVDFYIVQNDGSNLTKINIPMPVGEYPSGKGLLSPDGKQLVFKANSMSDQSYVYSYSLIDSKLTKLVSGSFSLQGTY